MRITNKMMTNNMMSNINKNKFNMSILEQQYSTGKRIQRPSEDPIIAVRALKLRTSLSELAQYHEKNIPDAFSWLDLTESAIKTINGRLGEINTQCVYGATDSLTAFDRSAIVQNLVEMKAQIYSEGNTNFAGRYVFTGYKTDSSLTFTEGTTDFSYEITESKTGADILSASSVVGSYGVEDFDDALVSFNQAPRIVDYKRIQLSYDQLDASAVPPIEIEYIDPVSGATVNIPFDDPVGTGKIKTTSITDDAITNHYEPDPDEIHYIPETGELILGQNVYNELKNASSIDMKYNKSSFSEGDLKPEHYFDCNRTNIDTLETIPFKRPDGKQEIQYEVNYNQKLTINTEGSEVISHKIGRDITEILNSVNDVIATEKKIAEVEKRLEDTTLSDKDRERYEKMLGQLSTELELKKEVMQDAFTQGNKTSDSEQTRVNMASADLGSRYVRLQLTENRLASQKVDFKDLMNQNENVNIVDTIIEFGSAEVIYNASLNAASRIVQNSLLDFLR
ncbi:MAG TPA: flagellar hook-associated protein FlgL [Clostridiales bacterium]|nr:flagellar hook-associated protein FlgL [Clostridiales bacterium]